MKNKFNLFRTVFLKQFLAVMVGIFVFGIMDNGIMVLVGSSIDLWIQLNFGFSTMFYEGLGNTLSDAIGVLSGSLVAKFVHNKFGKVKVEEVGDKLFAFDETLVMVLNCLVVSSTMIIVLSFILFSVLV